MASDPGLRLEAVRRIRPSVSSRTAASSLARGLAILALLSDRGETRADMIADALELPTSTVYRYLRTLREFGLVYSRDGVYRAAGGLEDESRGMPRADLIAVAAPALQRLADRTGETAALTVRVGAHAMCIHQIESRELIRMAFRIGQVLPIHAGASERALLAFTPADVVAEVLAGELPRHTPDTPDRTAIERSLATIRRTGVSVSRGEVTPGAVEIAAPVLSRGKLLCAISVTGPAPRCRREWQRRAKDAVREASAEIQRVLDESADDGRGARACSA